MERNEPSFNTKWVDDAMVSEGWKERKKFETRNEITEQAFWRDGRLKTHDGIYDYSRKNIWCSLFQIYLI